MIETIKARLRHLLTETHESDPYHQGVKDALEIVEEEAAKVPDPGDWFTCVSHRDGDQSWIGQVLYCRAKQDHLLTADIWADTDQVKPGDGPPTYKSIGIDTTKIVVQRIEAPTFERPLEEFSKWLKSDDDLAWTWHCNLACMIADATGGFVDIGDQHKHQKCNEGAADFMERAYGVDVTKFEMWQSFEWASQ